MQVCHWLQLLGMDEPSAASLHVAALTQAASPSALAIAESRAGVDEYRPAAWSNLDRCRRPPVPAKAVGASRSRHRGGARHGRTAASGSRRRAGRRSRLGSGT